MKTLWQFEYENPKVGGANVLANFKVQLLLHMKA